MRLEGLWYGVEPLPDGCTVIRPTPRVETLGGLATTLSKVMWTQPTQLYAIELLGGVG